MNKKIIYVFLSVLLVTLCIVTGTTYAYFSNENTIDLSASSEKLVVDIETSDFKMYSDNVEVKDNFTNGGYATLSKDGFLHAVNFGPKDKISFTLNFKNNSTNNVLYRMREVVYDDYSSYGSLMRNKLPHKWNEIEKNGTATFDIELYRTSDTDIIVEELTVQYYVDVLPVGSKEAIHSNLFMNEELYGVYEFDQILDGGSVKISSANFIFNFETPEKLEKYDETLPQKIALVKATADEVGLPNNYPGIFFRIDTANIKFPSDFMEIIWFLNAEKDLIDDFNNYMLKFKVDDSTVCAFAESFRRGFPGVQNIRIDIKENHNELCSSDFTPLLYFGYITVK